jgi:twitching motility protein PilT
MASLRDLLEEMVAKKASDLHITVGVPPLLRLDGEMVPVGEEKLVPQATTELAYSVLNEEQRKRFELDNDLDLSFGIQGLSRFRANVFLQRGAIAMAVRRIPYEIMALEELGLPPATIEFPKKNKGLILVTGPTGSGKSTTLAALLDRINSERALHIITIEDPIEYVHRHKRSIVNQREINTDTQSFPSALKYVLRQDPDVILVGEMRDLETIGAALTIAETGHLVFATLHTNSASEAVNRIVDVFPSEQQQQVLCQLAFVLEAVLTQQLIPKAGGVGRALAAELLIATPAIRAVIRERKLHQIYSLMQAGQKFGMQTMNQALFKLHKKRLITTEEALGRTTDPAELQNMLSKTALSLVK